MSIRLVGIDGKRVRRCGVRSGKREASKWPVPYNRPEFGFELERKGNVRHSANKVEQTSNVHAEQWNITGTFEGIAWNVERIANNTNPHSHPPEQSGNIDRLRQHLAVVAAAFASACGRGQHMVGAQHSRTAFGGRGVPAAPR